VRRGNKRVAAKGVWARAGATLLLLCARRRRERSGRGSSGGASGALACLGGLRVAHAGAAGEDTSVPDPARDDADAFAQRPQLLHVSG
jgi:hypothetical protein